MLCMVKSLVMMRNVEERHVPLKVSKVDITYVHGQSPGRSRSLLEPNVTHRGNSNRMLWERNWD